MKYAWVVNLDADIELAIGKTYSPSKAIVEATRRQAETFATFVREIGDCLVGEGDVELGRAFCPTPRAIAAMQRAGITPEPYPDIAILRKVNGRAFCATLGQTLPGAEFVYSVVDAERLLASSPPVGRQWRAKRAFGMAGRGQRPIAAGPLSAADASFLAASLERDGGIQLEPEVAIEREVSMHGILDQNGGLFLGRVVVQNTLPTGQWAGSAPSDEELPALTTECRRVAEALHAAGYFGPFNVDAYFYRQDGESRFQPRSEINARYSMGIPASGLFTRESEACGESRSRR